MIALALDPGPAVTGYVAYDLERRDILESGNLRNAAMRDRVREGDEKLLLIEYPEVFGSTGTFQAVLNTCFECGRYVGLWQENGRSAADVYLVTRRQVKLHLLGRAAGTDSQVRAMLISLLGEPGVKAEPGPTHGVTKHAWAALAVAVTFEETMWRG